MPQNSASASRETSQGKAGTGLKNKEYFTAENAEDRRGTQRRFLRCSPCALRDKIIFQIAPPPRLQTLFLGGPLPERIQLGVSYPDIFPEDGLECDFLIQSR
jgi:hypothetical protein